METRIRNEVIPFPRRNNITAEGLVYLAHLDDSRLPEFSITPQEDSLLLEIDEIPESISQVGSSIIVGHQRFEVGKVSTLIHDFTFAAIAEETDKPLSRHFPIINDGEDHLTPDLIIDASATEKRVIEFATHRGPGVRGVLNYYNQKIEKYTRPLAARQERTQWDISLSCIAVGYDHVVSDLTLSQATVDELVYRFRFASAVFNQILVAFPELAPKVSEEISSAERAGRECLNFLTRTFIEEPEGESLLENFPLGSKRYLDAFLENSEDEQYLKRVFAGTFQETLDEIRGEHILEGHRRGPALERNGEEASSQMAQLVKDQLDAYLKQKVKQDESKFKSTIKIPGWLIPDTPRTIDIGINHKDLEGMSDETVTARVWKAALTEVIFTPQNSWQEDLEREYAIATSRLQVDPEGENTKQDYHRVKINLPAQDWVSLAARGLEGKSMRQEELVRKTDEASHTVLSPHHDISGISSCIESNNWFHHFKLGQEENLYGVLDVLISSAMEVATDGQQVGEKILKAFKDYRNLNCVHWASMVTQIATELAIAAKQSCKRHHFIIKKVPNFPIYMLIKTSRSGSHVFYSLAARTNSVKHELSGRVFKEYERSGNWFITEFNSVKLCKVENMLKLPMLIVALISYSQESDEKVVTKLSRPTTFTRKLVTTAIMVCMEDKALTEELITIQRYIQMEGFVTEPLLPKPHKMLEKLSVPLRTTLQVFLFQQCLKAIRSISRTPYRRMCKAGEVSWRGCFSGVIGMSCSPEQMVNSWYLGYLKNKDEDTEVNMLGAMYEKIVKVEEKRPLDSSNLLGGDPLKPNMHEFSGSFIKFMARALNDEIRGRKGHNWQEEITTQFYRSIGSVTLDQLATLKASSSFGPEWENFDDVRLKEYHRVKVLERISELVQEGHTFYTDTIGQCFRVVLEDGCMRICLFKKAQHGGLREIYVLRLEERLIQFGIELLARKINEAVGHETISVPSRKEEILDTHQARAAKACGEGTLITVCSSNDARTWNQGHYTTKFAFLMCELMPRELHGFIWMSCAIFRKKKMMLNLDYLNSMCRKRPEASGFKQRLYDGFSGNEEVPWIQKGKTFIQTETGMMQGILHLTSSLFHAAYQAAIRKILKAKLKTTINSRVLIDVIEGSDDSAIVISAAVKSDDEERKFRLMASVLLHWVKRLGLYAGIYMSPKSTIGCIDVCEYNSEFRFSRLMCRPTLKWVTACLNIPEVEKIADRQESFSNLLTSVLEGGGTSSLCSVLQLTQAWCHYVLLGLWSSCVFKLIAPYMEESKNPDIGFFILDCPVSAGILGFRHNLWRYVRKTKLSAIFAKILDNKGHEGFTLTSGGSLSKCHLIRWGDRKKLDGIKNRTGMNLDWRILTDEDPSLLYKPPQNNHEVKVAISLKLDSPGVAESLSKGNVLGRVIASSVYILQRRCITVRSQRRKYTLAELMLETEDVGRTLTLAEENALFGDIIALEKNEALCQSYGEAIGNFIGKSREMRRAKVEVLSADEAFRAPPVKIMGDVFFGTTKSHMGQNMLARELGYLKESFPWISADPHECLSNSPFTCQAELKTFFEKLEQKTRKVRMIGAAVFTRMGQTSLDNLLRFNFQKNFELTRQGNGEYEVVNEDEKFCKHVITMILSGPFSNERKSQMIVDFLKISDLSPPKTLLKKSRTNVLRVIRAWLEGHSRIEELVERSMDGICGAFTVRQKISRDSSGQLQYRGLGVWTGRIEGTDCRLQIENSGPGEQVLKQVTISSDKNLSDFLSGLERLCKELRVTNPRKSWAKQKKQDLSLIGALVDFKLESRLSCAGCPLRLVPASEGFLKEMMDRSNISLIVRGDILNIKADLGDGRLITMISYKASGQDADQEQGARFFSRREVLKTHLSWSVREPYLSWISLRPVPDALVPRLEEEIMGKRRTEGIDAKQLKDVYQRCCKSSLRRKGLTVGQFSTVKLRIEDTSDDVEINLLELLEEEVDFTSTLERTSLDMLEDSIEDMEVFFGEEDLEIFDFTELISRADPLAYHGFCDRIIEDFVKKLGHDVIRRAIQKREMLQTDAELVKKLFDCIGENPEELEIVHDELDEYASSGQITEEVWG
ncbi:RNA-dependent RNA polymerase [Lone Star virus]|uniref:RNA-directed RNA polymerase L n=1 Tax=Lone Star virus TaxID=1219465 RepID=R4NUK2_9VIRU|nr:RNA-dependent RNA polymerase [Lone Star virus]AGL50921.1 RNA-dependent RNA polymerase [Lone Star virus]